MPSIGDIFREARTRKGVTEEVAAKAIKIKVERLRDLEENRYDEFPAYVYLRGFLRHYADYLGIESQPILQQFAEEHPAPHQKPIFEIIEDQHFHCPIHRHVPSSGYAFWLTPTGRVMMTVAFVILLIAGVTFWWMSRTPGGHGSNPRGPDPEPPPAVPAPKKSGPIDENWGTPIAPSLAPGTNGPPSRTAP